MTKLADPKGLWGASDSIHTEANRAGAARLPHVTSWMGRFHMTEAQLGSLEAAIQSAGQGHVTDGVRAWLAENPGVEETMTPGVSGSGAGKS